MKLRPRLSLLGRLIRKQDSGEQTQTVRAEGVAPLPDRPATNGRGKHLPRVRGRQHVDQERVAAPRLAAYRETGTGIVGEFVIAIEQLQPAGCRDCRLKALALVVERFEPLGERLEGRLRLGFRRGLTLGQPKSDLLDSSRGTLEVIRTRTW